MKEGSFPTYSIEEWNGIFARAEESGLSNKQWCQQHQLPYRSFTAHKYRMKKQGLLRIPTPEALSFEQTNETYVSYRQEEHNRELFFYLEPLQRCNRSLFTVLITRVMGTSLDKGNVYVFVSHNRKRLYALQGNGTGQSVTKCEPVRGRIPWPKEGDRYLEPALQRLLSLL